MKKIFLILPLLLSQAVWADTRIELNWQLPDIRIRFEQPQPSFHSMLLIEFAQASHYSQSSVERLYVKYRSWPKVARHLGIRPNSARYEMIFDNARFRMDRSRWSNYNPGKGRGKGHRDQYDYSYGMDRVRLY